MCLEDQRGNKIHVEMGVAFTDSRRDLITNWVLGHFCYDLAKMAASFCLHPENPSEDLFFLKQ